ncbi:NAD(P)-binding protein [Panus rudis PR-1116 ss-1]|nr:NAD(P)-binding protein [Panus rudis PR-1116 ss-1]
MSNPSDKLTIFLTGAIGYIGGTVLARLLEHPKASTFDITILVRSPEKAQKFESFGVKAVVTSLEDEGTIEEVASKAHIVINTANADHLKAAQAILRGLKKRHETTGDVPILIHTSGTGTFTDNAKGLYASDTIWDDANPAQIETLPDNAVHRHVDLPITRADEEGYVRSYIILPGIIFGIAKTPFVEAGLQNPVTIAIPVLTKAAQGRGRAGVVGKGLAIWPYVHIDDTVDLYILLLDAILSNPDKVDHGRNGYYIAANMELSWYDFSKAIGQAFVDLGIHKDAEPTTFTTEELVKYFGSENDGWVLGTNARCRANHSYALGWKPKYTVQNLLEGIKEEVQFNLRR